MNHLKKVYVFVIYIYIYMYVYIYLGSSFVTILNQRIVVLRALISKCLLWHGLETTL